MSIIKLTLAPTLIIIGLGIAGAVTAYVLSYAVASISGALILYLSQYRIFKALIEKDGPQNNNFMPLTVRS